MYATVERLVFYLGILMLLMTCEARGKQHDCHFNVSLCEYGYHDHICLIHCSRAITEVTEHFKYLDSSGVG